MSRLLYRLGFMLRETGQSLDKLGCYFQDNPAFREQLWRHRTLLNLGSVKPKVSSSSFVAPSASVIGEVAIGDKSSVWYGAVLRADSGAISVGSGSNIQDNAVITTAKGGLGLHAAGSTIGNNVTVGHNAMLQGASVGDGSLIGIGAVLREGVVVEKGAMVAAGSVVAPHTVVPSGQLWAGNPAAYMRDLKAEETKYMAELPGHYTELAAEHAKEADKRVEQLVEEKVAGLPTVTA